MLYGFPLLTMNVLCHDQRAAVDAQTRLAETQSALDAEAEIMRGFLEVALVQHLGVAEQRGGDAEALAHAQRVVADATLRLSRCQAHEIEHLVDA